MTDEQRDAVRRRRGYWVRLARRNKGLGLKEFGHALGYTGNVTGNLSKWETGDRPIPSDMFEPIARVVGLPPNFLVRPPLTDEERLDAAIRLAAEQELQDWAEGVDRSQEADDEPDAGPGRLSA
jgi:transcriptional regulator with XRE-family HTH domain